MSTTSSPTLQLTNSHLGDLFTVPRADWQAISQRVGMTLLAEGIAPTIGRFLPSFPELVAVCRQWKDTTFPNVVSQSAHLGAYASSAIDRFSALRELISAATPSLLPLVKQQAETELVELLRSTQQLAEDFEPLTGQVRSFAFENDAVDAQINAYAGRLGPGWTSIRPATQAVDVAVGRVLGTWQALADDLSAIACGRIGIKLPILGLQIEVALKSWSSLQQEAKAFASLAETQRPYLDGQGLKGAARVTPAEKGEGP